MKSIYIGNLDYYASEKQILDLFAQFGEVLSISVIKDKKTKKSKGYGFIEMDDDNADTAISMLNNENFMKRVIVVKETQNKNKTKE